MLLCYKLLGSPGSEGRWIEPQRQSGMNLGLRLMWSTWRRPLRTRTGALRLVPTKGLILPASARASSRLQPRVELRGSRRASIDALFCRERRLVAGALPRRVRTLFLACDQEERRSQSLDRRRHRIRKRAFIPLASPGSIPGNSASSTIVSPHSPDSMMIPGSEAAAGGR